jgi:glycosyltransferase involved in cell wall biosynthesis
VADYPDYAETVKAESLPFVVYKQMMLSCDVLLDQIYSYTPAMNALQAMSRGIIVVGGGERENYEILGEKELRPIINVQPDEEDVYRQLEWLVLHPERLSQLKRDSIEYVRRHHDSLKVAEMYLEVWGKELSNSPSIES